MTRRILGRSLEKMTLKTESNTPGPLLRFLRRAAHSLRKRLTRTTRARFLYLEVTHRCNLRCVACYTGAGAEKKDALNLDEQKAVVRQAKDMGARIVSLSGSGEPLLYKRLFELIDYIRQLDMDVVVFTNGTVIDSETAEFLMSRNVIVYFKLYSLDPEVFDRMVGKQDAYRWVDYTYLHDGSPKTRKIPFGLKCLLDSRRNARNPKPVRIEALITKINADTLPDVAEFCEQCDIGFYLETPVFKGRAFENHSAIALDAAGYRNLYDKLCPTLGIEYLEKARDLKCPVERNPVVWTNGDVGFCSSRPAPVGNVRDAPLRKLFARAKKLKLKEDRLIMTQSKPSTFFRTCPARQQYEIMHDLTCDY